MYTTGGRIRHNCLRGLQVGRFSVPRNGTLWGDGPQGYRYCVDCYMRQMDLHAFSRVKDSAAVPLWEGFSSDTFRCTVIKAVLVRGEESAKAIRTGVREK